MSSISLAHGFSRHAKIVALSDLAFRIWVAGIERAHEQLTDGLLRSVDLDLLPRMPTNKRAREAVVAEIVAAKLWSVVVGGWQIHDFLEWQDSSAEARRKRDAARERMRRSRLAGEQIVRANATRTEQEQFGEQFGEQTENVPGTFAVRSQNVLGRAPAPALSLISSGSLSSPDLPALSASSEGPESLSARGTKRPKKWRIVPAEWEPTEDHRAIASARGVDFELELAKFRDHEFAQPKSNANATFRNWLRSARPTVAPYRRSAPVQSSHGQTGFEGTDP